MTLCYHYDHMLKKRLNILIIIIVGFFLAIDFAWYTKSLEQLRLQNVQRQSIIFLNLKVETTRLLDKLMYSYEKEKEALLKTHKRVYEYLKNRPNPTELSLDEIYKLINAGLKEKPYNIYITDKNFVIKNTTFKKDLGLDLSFAKDIFLSDYKAKRVGVSTPIYETADKTFFSYTDSFLNYQEGKGNILQISYNYKNTAKSLANIKEIFAKFPSIQEHKCYTKSSENQAYEIILKDYKSYKLDSKEIYQGIKRGEAISKKLKDKELYIEPVVQDGKRYAALYTVQHSTLFNENSKVLHYLLLDESEFEKDVHNLNIVISLIVIIGIFVIIFFAYFMNRILINPILKLQKSIQEKEPCTDVSFLARDDELGQLFTYYNHYFEQIKNSMNAKDELLQDKNRFVHNAIHEINTPLSVISTNNSLRDLTQGENEYSVNITSAVKTLKNTMDDLNFSMHNNQMTESVEVIDLANFLNERVDYFQSIAESSGINLRVSHLESCLIEITEIELTRWIDNNLSNAIKYSFIDSDVDIELKLENDLYCLSFTNRGQKIEDVEKIFQRFHREDNVHGGFGIGLNIVQSICDKYGIKIVTLSQENINTFSYYIKCHTKVIP